MNFKKDIAILQIIEDNDGEYSFLKEEECKPVAAYNTAWERHSEFLKTEKGMDFSGKDCMNSEPDDFIRCISEYGVAVTANEDMTYRRIYKLIHLTVDFKFDINVG